MADRVLPNVRILLPSDDGSEGQFESAGVYSPVKETDCSTWDTSPTDWCEGQFESAAITVLTPPQEFIEAPPDGIGNDEALAATRARISQILDELTVLRSNSRPEEFARVSRNSRVEVERLQREVLDYLTRPPVHAG